MRLAAGLLRRAAESRRRSAGACADRAPPADPARLRSLREAFLRGRRRPPGAAAAHDAARRSRRGRARLSPARPRTGYHAGGAAPTCRRRSRRCAASCCSPAWSWPARRRGARPIAGQAARLAAELARLLDQVQTERVLDFADPAPRWCRRTSRATGRSTLDFLQISPRHWPACWPRKAPSTRPTGATGCSRRRRRPGARRRPRAR